MTACSRPWNTSSVEAKELQVGAMQQLIHVVAAVSVAGGVMMGCCGLGETRQGYAALAEEQPSASNQDQVEQEALAVRQAAEASAANARVATLEQELEGVREERNALQVKCGQLETTLESQSIAAASLKANSDEELHSRDSVIAQLQESVAEEVAKAACLQRELADAEVQLTAAAAAKDTLCAAVQESLAEEAAKAACLQRQLENAEGQLAAAAAAKDILQERNGTMKGALGTLEAANSKLAVEAQELQERLAGERGEVVKLRLALEESKQASAEELASLQANVAEAVANSACLQRQLVAAVAARETLQNIARRALRSKEEAEEAKEEAEDSAKAEKLAYYTSQVENQELRVRLAGTHVQQASSFAWPPAGQLEGTNATMFNNPAGSPSFFAHGIKSGGSRTAPAVTPTRPVSSQLPTPEQTSQEELLGLPGSPVESPLDTSSNRLGLLYKMG
ncbi:hypothetical protein N2152v2_002293 [Parachlorella kessleri]